MEPQLAQVQKRLRDLGIGVRLEWLRAFAKHCDAVKEGYGVPRLLRSSYEQFLYADVKHMGTAVLPDNVQQYHQKVLQGQYILQVNAQADLAECAEKRSGTMNSARRFLKLSLTDGTQHVSAIEYQRCPRLKIPDQGAGVKIAVRDVMVRRGLLLLQPDKMLVLGGELNLLSASKDVKKEVKAEGGGPLLLSMETPDRGKQPKQEQTIKRECSQKIPPYVSRADTTSLVKVERGGMRRDVRVPQQQQQQQKLLQQKPSQQQLAQHWQRQQQPQQQRQQEQHKASSGQTWDKRQNNSKPLMNAFQHHTPRNPHTTPRAPTPHTPTTHAPHTPTRHGAPPSTPVSTPTKHGTSRRKSSLSLKRKSKEKKPVSGLSAVPELEDGGDFVDEAWMTKLPKGRRSLNLKGLKRSKRTPLKLHTGAKTSPPASASPSSSAASRPSSLSSSLSSASSSHQSPSSMTSSACVSSAASSSKSRLSLSSNQRSPSLPTHTKTERIPERRREASGLTLSGTVSNKEAASSQVAKAGFQYWSARDAVPIHAVMRIKAALSTMVHFSCDEGVYNLRVMLDDGVLPVEVQLSDALVTRLAGNSGAVLQAMPQPQQDAALAHLQAVLKNIGGIMTLERTAGKDIPTVTDICEPTKRDVAALLHRVKSLMR